MVEVWLWSVAIIALVAMAWDVIELLFRVEPLDAVHDPGQAYDILWEWKHPLYPQNRWMRFTNLPTVDFTGIGYLAALKKPDMMARYRKEGLSRIFWFKGFDEAEVRIRVGDHLFCAILALG